MDKRAAGKKPHALMSAVKAGSVLATVYASLASLMGVWMSATFEPIGPVDLVNTFRPWPKIVVFGIQTWLIVFVPASALFLLGIVTFERILSRSRQ